MSQSRPDDVGNLLSQVDLDLNNYKFFRSEPRKNAPAPEAPAAGSAPEAPSAPEPPPVPQASAAPPVIAAEAPDAGEETPVVPAATPDLGFPPPAEPAVLTPRPRMRRWTGLDGVLSGHVAQENNAEMPVRRISVPAVTLLSVSGGVGATSIAAALARLTAREGERALLLDAAIPSLLPFFFGARAARPQLSTFVAPDGNRSGAVHIASRDEGLTPAGDVAWIWDAVASVASDTDVLIADVPVRNVGDGLGVFLKQTIPVLVLVPDVRCLASLQYLQGLLDEHEITTGKAARPFLLLNAFEAANPLHQEVQGRIAAKFKDRLLPFTIRRDQRFSDALAHGMTIVDYAPGSPVTQDLFRVAEWLRAKSAGKPSAQALPIR